MIKYLRGFIYLFSGAVRTLFLKIARGANYKAVFPILVSPSTRIEVERGGKLVIGKRISLRSGCQMAIRSNACLTIGRHFFANTGCVISAHDSITIGDNVQFGPHVFVYDQDHDFRAEGGLAAKQFVTKPVVIGNNVWIGANSIILRGTTIGDNCVVGAGSIIKGNFPANSVIVQKRETEVTSLLNG